MIDPILFDALREKEAEIATLRAQVAKAEGRIAELLDACNQKQALLDNVAEDQRGMMDLVEEARRERDNARHAIDYALSERQGALMMVATLNAALRDYLEVMRHYWEWNGIEHDDYECPEDDTCECPGVREIQKAEAAARAALDPSCPACHGTGQEGTGQPSDEGGEAFRACSVCGGSGNLERQDVCPACAPCPSCGHPQEWHERENWDGECIADGCACRAALALPQSGEGEP